MSTLAPIADKLGKLLRLLSSDRDGEVVGAARAIVRTLDSVGLDIHALAAGIGARVNGKKFSEAEALEIYDRGVADGRRAAEVESNGPAFRNVNLHDEPNWHEIASECEARGAQLRGEKEREFVADMVRRTVHGGTPTKRQAQWLRDIYTRIRRR